MFENVGGKLKTIAMAIALGGSIMSIFLSIIFFATGDYRNLESTENTLLIGILTFAGGILISLIFSYFCYGFGEIIDKLQQIEENTRQSVLNTPQGERKMPQGARKKGQHKSTPKGMPRTESVPHETQEIPSEKMPEETSSVEEDEYTESTFSIMCPKCKKMLWYQEENISFECPYCDCLIDTKKKK